MVTSKFLNPKNDVAFRKIFESGKHKDILIHFIKDILALEGSNKVEEVAFLSMVQDPDIAYKKESIVDVLCTDQYGKQIIVEMQVSPQQGFEKRGQYYASKAYSRQLKAGQAVGSRYQDLKEVIFIAITDYIVFQNKKDYFSNHIILDAKTYAHDLKDFSFTFIELPKFHIESIVLLSTMIEKWCYFFKYASSTTEEEVGKIIDSDLVIQRAYEALNRFNWSEKELLTYEKEIKRIMDNQAVEEYMIENATNKGMQIGEKKDRLEGRLEGKLEIAWSMLKNSYPIKDIVMLTGLPYAQIERLD